MTQNPQTLSLFERLAPLFGLDAANYPQPQERHVAILTWTFCCVASITWAAHIPLYGVFLKNIPAMLYCLLIGLPTSFLGLVLVKLRKTKAASIIAYCFGSATLYLIATVTGGAWSPVILWLLAFLLVIFLTHGVLHGLIYAAVTAPTTFIFVSFVDQWDALSWNFRFEQFSELHRAFWAATYSGTIFVIAYLSYIFENRVSQALRRSEKSRAEADQQRQLAEHANIHLKEQIAENASLINASDIGYCIFYTDLKINPSKVSRYFLKIFPEATHFRQVLRNLHIEAMQDLLQSIMGESQLTWELNEGSFVKESVINGSTHELSWRRVPGQNDETIAIVFVAVNVQPILDSKLKMEAVNRFAKLLVTIVGDHEEELHKDRERKSKRVMKAIKRQIPQVEEAIARAEVSLLDNWQPIFITLHTLKGEMSSFNFHELKEELHHDEEIVKKVRQIAEGKLKGESNSTLATEKLQHELQQELLHNLHHLLGRLEEIRRCCQQLGSDQDTVSLPRDGLLAARHNPRQLQQIINDSLFEDLHRTIMYFETEIYKIAGDLGKPVPRMIVKVPYMYLTEYAEEKLKQALTHVLRNALDHGIESRSERLSKGKSEQPEISFCADETADGIQLRIRDDGRGLDLERIEAKARKQGLLHAQAQLVRQDIAELIFLPGFSTSESVSLISGRGMGMEAARKYISELGGSVAIQLLDNSNSPAWEFILMIPYQHFPFHKAAAMEQSA